jgi:hypothetical protein
LTPMSAYGNILVPDRALGCTEAEAMEAWCSGLTCGPVKAETAGSNPVASALTNELDNLILHERQEIVDPLYYAPVSACSPYGSSDIGVCSVPTLRKSEDAVDHLSKLAVVDSNNAAFPCMGFSSVLRLSDS